MNPARSSFRTISRARSGLSGIGRRLQPQVEPCLLPLLGGDRLALLEESLANPAATGVANHPLFLAYLGEAHLLAGRPGDAAADARRALDLAHRQKERGNEAWVLRLLGEIAVQADPPDLESAEAHYGQALARADELGMRPLIAHCHLGLGKFYRHTGKRQGAHEHLTTATTMYREMDMRFWLEQAEAELKEPPA